MATNNNIFAGFEAFDVEIPAGAVQIVYGVNVDVVQQTAQVTVAQEGLTLGQLEKKYRQMFGMPEGVRIFVDGVEVKDLMGSVPPEAKRVEFIKPAGKKGSGTIILPMKETLVVEVYKMNIWYYEEVVNVKHEIARLLIVDEMYQLTDFHFGNSAVACENDRGMLSFYTMIPSLLETKGGSFLEFVSQSVMMCIHVDLNLANILANLVRDGNTILNVTVNGEEKYDTVLQPGDLVRIIINGRRVDPPVEEIVEEDEATQTEEEIDPVLNRRGELTEMSMQKLNKLLKELNGKGMYGAKKEDLIKEILVAEKLVPKEPTPMEKTLEEHRVAYSTMGVHQLNKLLKQLTGKGMFGAKPTELIDAILRAEGLM